MIDWKSENLVLEEVWKPQGAMYVNEWTLQQNGTPLHTA